MGVWTKAKPEVVKASAQWLPYYKDRCKFLFELCFTEDEVDTAKPVKLIPDLRHLRILIEAWETERLLAVVKSRRMLVSWACTALELHMAMTTPHSHIYIGSSDQKKSDIFVNRAKFIYEHLPKEMPKPQIDARMGQFGYPTRISFKETESFIEGIPGDPQKLRQEGATLIRLEEIAFWKPGWADLAYQAILPTIMGGGKLVMVSSARDGTFFKRLVFDETGSVVP